MAYNNAFYDYLPFEERQPYQGELNYFFKNPNVGGMKTEDQRIILNPYSQLSEEQLSQVRRNESIRLYLDQLKLTPSFPITEQQNNYFSQTPYKNDLGQMKNSIIARLLTNDPSAQDFNYQQKRFADYIYNQILNRYGR